MNAVIQGEGRKPPTLNLSGRIPELDGLRGIAIGMVLLYHYFFFHAPKVPGSFAAYAQVPLRLGWSGVDLFFVLSGFLIGGILLDARGSSNYFKVFYKRRFFRIVPLYAACLAAAFALYTLSHVGVANRFAWMYDGKLPWASYSLFLQNFWMARFNTAGAFPMAVTWSLAIEEQFYLTLPMLVRFLSRRQLVTALLVGIFVAPVFRITLYLSWPEYSGACYILTFSGGTRCYSEFSQQC